MSDSQGNPVSPQVPGIDQERVGAWLDQNVDGLSAPFEYHLIAGGKSNLTFRIRDGGGREVVLRRPPLGKTLPSAHDMGREFRILSALQGSIVPVPEPFGHCEDTSVNGAPFYVMEYLAGSVLSSPEIVERVFPEQAQRTQLAGSLISVLADLHAVEPEAVGLGELGRHEGYIERQLRRWHHQWNESKTREVPAIDEVHRRLTAAIPKQQRVSIVHGDYRLDNVISAADARVAGVLDWELCTLGDPLADLGGLMSSWIEAGESGAHLLGGKATALPGFPTRAELIAAYASKSGLDVAEIDYYVAFSHWKLACIAEGVYARFRAGVMGDGAGVSTAQLAEQVVILADLAAETIP